MMMMMMMIMMMMMMMIMIMIILLPGKDKRPKGNRLRLAAFKFFGASFC